MQKIFIVEDDEGILRSLGLYLSNSGFETELLNTGENAVESILEYKPDLVILDINLPVKNGVEICRDLRDSTKVPIIMLTARNSESDKLEAFNLGADDYLSKPFSPRELLARINSILRRLGDSTESEVIKFKNIALDIDKQTVSFKGKPVEITKNEYDIIKKIFQNDGKIVRRDELMDMIGYKEYLYDRTIDTHIKNIRRKLIEKDVILTIRGEGYRLNK